MNEDLVPTTIRWPRDLYEKLRIAAFEQRRAKTAIVIEATRKYLAEQAAEERGNNQ